MLPEEQEDVHPKLLRDQSAGMESSLVISTPKTTKSKRLPSRF